MTFVFGQVKQSKLKNVSMNFKDVKPHRFSKNVLESINIGHFQKISSCLILTVKLTPIPDSVS